MSRECVRWRLRYEGGRQECITLVAKGALGMDMLPLTFVIDLFSVLPLQKSWTSLIFMHVEPMLLVAARPGSRIGASTTHTKKVKLENF